jgi:hypothetical protein
MRGVSTEMEREARKTCRYQVRALSASNEEWQAIFLGPDVIDD